MGSSITRLSSSADKALDPVFLKPKYSSRRRTGEPRVDNFVIIVFSPTLIMVADLNEISYVKWRQPKVTAAAAAAAQRVRNTRLQSLRWQLIVSTEISINNNLTKRGICSKLAKALDVGLLLIMATYKITVIFTRKCDYFKPGGWSLTAITPVVVTTRKKLSFVGISSSHDLRSAFKQLSSPANVFFFLSPSN